MSFSFPWDDEKSIKAKILRDRYELKVLVENNEEKEIKGDDLSVGSFLEQIKLNVAS